jgi:hypothetical protein
MLLSSPLLKATLLWKASLLMLASVMFMLSGDPSVSPMFLLLLGYMVFLLLFTVYCCAVSLVVLTLLALLKISVLLLATASVLAITCDLAVEGALMLLLIFQMSMFLLLFASL